MKREVSLRYGIIDISSIEISMGIMNYDGQESGFGFIRDIAGWKQV